MEDDPSAVSWIHGALDCFRHCARRLPLVELAVEPGRDVVPQVGDLGAEEPKWPMAGTFTLAGSR